MRYRSPMLTDCLTATIVVISSAITSSGTSSCECQRKRQNTIKYLFSQSTMLGQLYTYKLHHETARCTHVYISNSNVSVHNPTMPVRRASLQCKTFKMATTRERKSLSYLILTVCVRADVLFSREKLWRRVHAHLKYCKRLGLRTGILNSFTLWLWHAQRWHCNKLDDAVSCTNKGT